MKAINTSTIVRLFSFLLLFCAAFPAKSQNEESPGFVGEWCNKNFATRGNTRINVRHDGTKLIVHMWGRCHPTECDLGERPATQSPSESLLVTWKESFATITQKLTLLADGNLQSSSRTRFTDNSGRTDYESNETFVKGLVHDWSDTPKDRRPRIPNPPTAPPPVGKTIPAPTVPQPKPSVAAPAYRTSPWSAWSRAPGVEYRYRWGWDPHDKRFAADVDAIFQLRSTQKEVWHGAARSVDCKSNTLSRSKDVDLQPNETREVTLRTPNCGTVNEPRFKPDVVRSSAY